MIGGGLYVRFFLMLLFSGPNFYPVILRPIFTKFQQMIGIWAYIIEQTLLFRSLKGRCHGNQFYGQNSWNRPICLQSSLSYSIMEWNIVVQFNAIWSINLWIDK